MKKNFIYSRSNEKWKGKVALHGWIYRARGSNKMKFIIL